VNWALLSKKLPRLSRNPGSVSALPIYSMVRSVYDWIEVIRSLVRRVFSDCLGCTLQDVTVRELLALCIVSVAADAGISFR
jgi:hypothetical protein